MSTFTVSTESRGFLLGTLIATGAGLALTITNSIYYSQARNNCQSISNTTANVMMWLNIILAVIFGIILIWAIYRLVVHPDLRKELGKKTSDYLAGTPNQPLTTKTTNKTTTVGLTPTQHVQTQLPLNPTISSNRGFGNITLPSVESNINSSTAS